MNPRYHEGIISTPRPRKWRSRSVGTSTGEVIEYTPSTVENVQQNEKENLSEEEWPSFARDVSVRKGYMKDKYDPQSYPRGMNKTQKAFMESEYVGAYLNEDLECPSSPQDAF